MPLESTLVAIAVTFGIRWFRLGIGVGGASNTRSAQGIDCFALRKLHLLLRAKALVAFPGSYGTFDELFKVLTLVQTRKIRPLAIVLVGEKLLASRL